MIPPCHKKLSVAGAEAARRRYPVVQIHLGEQILRADQEAGFPCQQKQRLSSKILGFVAGRSKGMDMKTSYKVGKLNSLSPWKTLLLNASSYNRRAKTMNTLVVIDTFISASKIKDTSVLSDVFTEDAIYVTHNGATYRGLAQIQEYFKTLFFEGEVLAWDVKRLLDDTAVEWHYEYRFNYAGSVSYDGVSLFEISNGKISLWRDFIQAAKRTYPLEVKDIELLQAAGRLETCADWIDTLSRHDERFRKAAEKLQTALDELASLLPDETMQPEGQEGGLA